MRNVGIICLLAIAVAAEPASAGKKNKIMADAAKPASAQERKLTEAEIEYAAGRAAFGEEKWILALDRFYRSIASNAKGGSTPLTAKQLSQLYYNSALCHEHLATDEIGVVNQNQRLELAWSAFVKARDTLLAADSKVVNANPELLADIGTKLEQLKKKMDDLKRVKAEPPPAIKEPPVHVVVPPAPPIVQPTEQTKNPFTTDPRRVRVEKINGDESTAKKYALPIGLGVTGGALFVTGLGMWAHSLVAVNNLREQDKTCGGKCNLQPQGDALRTQFVVGLTFNIVGLVAGSVAAVLGGLKNRTDRLPRVTLIPHSGGGEISVSF
ncbi:hypothetical protein FJZ48_02400 [Candidatus Uhrbacteria bacterium]|nr:hypothetical protein [Candidatus Uhrbacteria bacterium]